MNFESEKAELRQKVRRLKQALEAQQSGNLRLDLELQRERENKKAAWILASLKLESDCEEVERELQDCKQVWTLELHHMHLAMEVLSP